MGQCALASGSSSSTIGVGFDVGLSVGGYTCCVGLDEILFD
jgi:hypothetical protein